MVKEYGKGGSKIRSDDRKTKSVLLLATMKYSYGDVIKINSMMRRMRKKKREDCCDDRDTEKWGSSCVSVCDIDATWYLHIARAEERGGKGPSRSFIRAWDLPASSGVAAMASCALLSSLMYI